MGNNNSLTPEEVAEILKIKKHTVYELVKRGICPPFVLGASSGSILKMLTITGSKI
jgi:predicted DNA-binding transcriptional regulator AlpA